MSSPVPSISQIANDSVTAIDNYGVYPAFVVGPSVTPVTVPQQPEAIAPVEPVASAQSIPDYLGTMIDTLA